LNNNGNNGKNWNNWNNGTIQQAVNLSFASGIQEDLYAG